MSQALDDAKYMRITTTVSSDRPSTLGSVTAFNVDDFRAQLPALLANGGTVGFNLATRDEVEQAVTVARELGYETRVDVSGLRVEVRRVP